MLTETACFINSKSTNMALVDDFLMVVEIIKMTFILLKEFSRKKNKPIIHFPSDLMSMLQNLHGTNCNKVWSSQIQRGPKTTNKLEKLHLHMYISRVLSAKPSRMKPAALLIKQIIPVISREKRFLHTLNTATAVSDITICKKSCYKMLPTLLNDVADK